MKYWWAFFTAAVASPTRIPVVVDHTTHTTAKIQKENNLSWISLVSVFSPSRLHLLSKNLDQAFCSKILFVAVYLQRLIPLP